MRSQSPPSRSRATSRGLVSPRLAELARPAEGPSAESVSDEQCELCGLAIAPEHRHLLDLEHRSILCVCRACSTLFDHASAGGGHYRLIGDRRLRLDDFELPDEVWERLRIPVDMAFFFRNSGAGRIVAFYPGAMGATESRLELGAWEELELANPILGELEPDVEALLVNHARGARSHWLVPIDDCYRLVAVIRTRWRGFSGGKEVWLEIDGFFAELEARARAHRTTTARR